MKRKKKIKAKDVKVIKITEDAYVTIGCSLDIKFDWLPKSLIELPPNEKREQLGFE